MRAVQEPVRGEVNDAIPVQPGGKHSLHTGVKIQGAEATAGRNESQDSSGFLSRIKQPRKTRQAIRKQCLLLRWVASERAAKGSGGSQQAGGGPYAGVVAIEDGVGDYRDIQRRRPASPQFTTQS